MKNLMTATILLCGLANALAQGTFQFTVHPIGAEEVPPNSSGNLAYPGTLTLNDTTLRYGFAVLPANNPRFPTSATINGPAGLGVIGPMLFDLGASTPTINPPGGGEWHGSITGLTSTQITDLIAGLWYVNVFTDASFPGGEYRGQITLVPEPSCLAFLGLCGMVAAFWHKRRR